MATHRIPTAAEKLKVACTSAQVTLTGLRQHLARQWEPMVVRPLLLSGAASL